MGKILAVSVVGSAFKFKRWERWDGSSEYFKFIWAMSRKKDIDKIYLLSKSDFSNLGPLLKADLDPHGKIIDMHSLAYRKYPWDKKYRDTEPERYYSALYNFMEEEGYKPDFGLCFIGPGLGNRNIPGFLTTWKGTKAKVLDMTFYYASPIVYYLNKSKLPWFAIATDPRYFPEDIRRYDVSNPPKEIIGQFNVKHQWHAIEEYDCNLPIIQRPVKQRYSGVERMNLIKEEYVKPNAPKDIRFCVVSLQLSPESATQDYRFDILKSWILDYDKNQEMIIYGRWSDYFKNGYPQFKGFIPSEEMDPMFKRTKYTLVIPTKAGWVTSKYAEMLSWGVVPFLHPGYDPQYNIVPKDHFIRVVSPLDFYEKMEYLDAHDDKRIELIDELQKKFVLNAKNGDFLLDAINPSLEKFGLPIIEPGDDTTTNTSFYSFF